MRTRVRHVPLSRPVPAPKGGYRRAQFKVKGARIFEDLDYELERLGASEAIVETALSRSQIRLDGWPKSGAVPASPGLRITIDTKARGVLVFEAALYDRFEHNIRAVSMHLEALRAVDRYGVSKNGEQYRGWAALPAGPAGSDSLRSSVRWLCEVGGLSSSSSDVAAMVDAVSSGDDAEIKRLLNCAARSCHPDTGGSVESFSQYEFHSGRVKALRGRS